MNTFYTLPTQPFHISVGAVLFGEDYKICLHRFYKQNILELDEREIITRFIHAYDV